MIEGSSVINFPTRSSTSGSLCQGDLENNYTLHMESNKEKKHRVK